MRRSWLALVLVAVLTAAPLAVTTADARSDKAKVGKIVDDRDLVRTGKWTSKASSTSWQKTLSKSKVKGAKLTTKESTASGGAVTFQTGPDRGKAQIFVGGVKKATVKTAANKKKTKVAQFTGSGKVVIKVKSPGKKGVYVDVVLLNDIGTPPSTTPHPGAGEVIFTEWMSNTDTVPQADGEWFELANVAEDTWSLDGCTVTDGETTTTLSAADMPGSNTFVFVRNTNSAANGGITADGGETLTLTSTDSLTLTCGATVIDMVSWTSEISGQSTSLDDQAYSAAMNDIASNYCPGATPYGTGTEFGTPRLPNASCP